MQCRSVLIVPFVVLCAGEGVLGNDSHAPFTYEELASRSTIIAVATLTHSEQAPNSDFHPDYYRRYVSRFRIRLLLKGTLDAESFEFEHFRLKRDRVPATGSFVQFPHAVNEALDSMALGETVDFQQRSEVYLIFATTNGNGRIFSPASGNDWAEYSVHRLVGRIDEKPTAEVGR
jgi:hypothetical protein